METQKITPIGEKVKFWEEQDKINQAVIPRIIELNESLKKLSSMVSQVDEKIASAESRIIKKVKMNPSNSGNKYIVYLALLLSIASTILTIINLV